MESLTQLFLVIVIIQNQMVESGEWANVRILYSTMPKAGFEPGSPAHTVFEHCVGTLDRSTTIAGMLQ